MRRYLSVDTKNVMSKVVDGEVILIDLSNGMYYSMRSVANYIWSLLDEGHDLDIIAAKVAHRYSAAEETVKLDVEALGQQLLGENLVMATESQRPTVSDAIEIDLSTEPYTTPKLEKFDDMVDLFALDPPLPELSNLKQVAGENE